MKLPLLLTLLSLLGMDRNLSGQIDSIYIESFHIASKNGLKVRSSPTINSESLGTLEFKEIIKAEASDIIDTIDNRVSNWYRLKGELNGFVFGGYLNRFPLPDSTYGLFNDYIPKFIESQFAIQLTKSFNTRQLGLDKEFENIEVIHGENITIIKRLSYEYSSVEYFISGVDVNEFINIFEIMKYYYGDRDNEIIPIFNRYNLKSFYYSVPDAGMQDNYVEQFAGNVVKIKFIFSL